MVRGRGEGEAAGIYSGRAEISATRHGSSRCEMFLPSDASGLARDKQKLAPTFKDAPPLTLLGLTELSNRRTRVKVHSSVFPA